MILNKPDINKIHKLELTNFFGSDVYKSFTTVGFYFYFFAARKVIFSSYFIPIYIEYWNVLFTNRRLNGSVFLYYIARVLYNVLY